MKLRLSISVHSISSSTYKNMTAEGDTVLTQWIFVHTDDDTCISIPDGESTFEQDTTVRGPNP